jgi:hypothetical protein
MYYQQCPYYMQNICQAQMMPYMRNDQNMQMASPESTMLEQQIEMMYPKRYRIIYPVVVLHCDMFDKTYGTMRIPTREEIERMTDDIYSKVEADVEATMSPESRETEMRQFGFIGRGFLRDLIAILLLREFLGRRRRRPGYRFGDVY